MRREHDDLFESKNGKIYLKIDLVVDGKQYHLGDDVTDLKFPTFSLSDNPDKYFYNIKGKRLISRVKLG